MELKQLGSRFSCFTLSWAIYLWLAVCLQGRAPPRLGKRLDPHQHTPDSLVYYREHHLSSSVVCFRFCIPGVNGLSCTEHARAFISRFYIESLGIIRGPRK